MKNRTDLTHIGPWYTVAACCAALGVSSRTAVRYRAMREGIAMRRLGNTDLVRLDRLREVFEREQKGQEG